MLFPCVTQGDFCCSLHVDTAEGIEFPEPEAMELEHLDEEEMENRCESVSGNNEAAGNPDPVNCEGTSAKETECTTKSSSCLPQSKEELERTIKNIQGTVTGDILPRLHKCLASTVITVSGTQEVSELGCLQGPVSLRSVLFIDFSFWIFLSSQHFTIHLLSHVVIFSSSAAPRQ